MDLPSEEGMEGGLRGAWHLHTNRSILAGVRYSPEIPVNLQNKPHRGCNVVHLDRWVYNLALSDSKYRA